MANTVLKQLRSIVLALPGVEERVSHRAPCFYVGRRAICRFHDVEFGSDDRVALWCLAAVGVAEELSAAEPGRFFRPTPSASGVFGDWLGVYLDLTGDDAIDWPEIEAILEEAYRLVAPKRLLAELDSKRTS